MSRIAKTFQQLKTEGRGACLPYLTIGYPELDSTVPLALALFEAGADIIELGVPFSDPLADGPTIQHASHVALENGVTRQKCFEVARAIRAQTDNPLVFMGYYNPIFSYGLERYIKECAEAGIDGLIVPDLALEEAAELLAVCQQYGLDLVQFVAPTSTEDRIQKVAELATGFIYCVSIAGVTGARGTLPDYLPEYIKRVRQYTTIPLVIGFGISNHALFSQATELADGAAVGAALIDAIGKAAPGKAVEAAVTFLRELRGEI